MVEQRDKKMSNRREKMKNVLRLPRDSCSWPAGENSRENITKEIIMINC